MEQISDVNNSLSSLNDIVEQIAIKKAFLEKAVNQIQIGKLVVMENDFLKNESKRSKEFIEHQ